MTANFVDRAVRRAQDDVHAQAIRYTPQPERMTDAGSEAFQVRKLHARIVALEQRMNAVEMLLADETAKHVAYEESLAHLRQYELPAEARWHREPLTGEDVPDTDDTGEEGQDE